MNNFEKPDSPHPTPQPAPQPPSPPAAPPKKLSGIRVIGIILLLAVGVFIGRYIIPATVGASQPFEIISTGSNQRQFVFPTFWEAWDKLHKNYIGDLDDKDLFYGAVAGMVRATGDRYTVFSDPEETKQFEETLEGEFSGVGIEIGVRQGLVTVIAPLEGSPADKAGIEEGDIIVKVDGTDIEADTTIDEVVRMIRGPHGQPVALTIARQDAGELIDVEIIRDTIHIDSVDLTIEDSIAHLEIDSFNGDTDEQFLQAVRDITSSNNVSGIVLDVRNNPGGFLQTAVDIASFFLEPGTVVVTEKGDSNTEHIARGNPLLEDIPVVVLVNQGSASASEILAGALQDQRGVPVIGEKTFGKGSVQELISLSDGSSLRITVAKWFTPSGRSINDEGIAPDIEAKDNRETEDVDEQLQRAIEELNS